MNEYKKDKWWYIYNLENKVQGEEICPLLPMAGGRNWQKGLAVFYGPCSTVTLSHKKH
ncbi:MAG: hypothetical protein HOJ48_04910 [Desulfobacula sp.]|jgi:hypothetical protein|nr:hypothetical protein [Desulfobacula sp.]